MILGFTGTRAGMTDAQYEAVTRQVATLAPDTLLNGGAVGADEQLICWAIANRRTGPGLDMKVEVYPASVQRARYWNRYLHQRLIETIWRVQEPLKRNRAIAERCHRLIAAPKSYHEELRSGTWATVRYAIEAGKPATIVHPDGTSYTRDPTPRNAAPRDSVGDLIERQHGSLPLNAHFRSKAMPL